MTELARAAEQLRAQVSDTGEKVKVEPAGKPDGFGITRSLEFDPATSKWLVPVLEAIEDERIRSIEYEGKNAVVTFVADTRADFDDEFPLDEAREVLEGDA